jgi:hypothetical protein
MLKHVGRLKNNQRRLIVAYRTLPGEPDHCVCVTTENLEAGDHDALMKLVESNAGQTANELAEAMARTRLPDGSIMLARFHKTGKMGKFKTTEVEMTPNSNTIISLDEMNKAIAEQKGVAIEDLAIQNPVSAEATVQNEPTAPVETPSVQQPQAPQDGVLSDEDLAANYRSQADRMFKEAKRLREQAEELAPTKKKKAATQSA